MRPILKYVAHWLIVMTAMAIFIGLGGIAEAHSTTSRVWNMREIAAATFGPDVCGNTMTVPIERGPMLHPDWAAYAHHEGDTAPYHDCYIVVADLHWDTERLCRVVLHEYGHLSGYRAPEGQEYIRPDGTSDYDHSNNPRDLMWPFVIDTYPPCANGASDTARHMTFTRRAHVV